MRELYKKHSQLIKLIIFIILLLTVALIINHCSLFYDYIKSKPQADATQEINTWFSFVSGAATAGLTVIAWLKFGGFHMQNQTNILLQIDERWGNPEIIKARIIIHEIYLQVKKNNRNLLVELGRHCRDSSIQNSIGEKIIELSNTKKKEVDFIYLLNFLDFMETIGYIESIGQITVDELEALCGESLMFNYKIFKPYIQDKRSRHQNDEFYENFDKLYEKLKDKKKK